MSDPSSISNVPTLPSEAQNAALVPTPESTRPFLRLYLPDLIVLLPIQQVAEVLNVSIAQIVPLPHLPAWMMGVYNWRGEILWMVDFGHLCGLPPWYQQSGQSGTHAVAILQIRTPTGLSTASKTQTLGLVIRQVGEIEWCSPEMIKPLSSATVPPKLSPFLHGYWWQPEGDMLAVLDGAAILSMMPK